MAKTGGDRSPHPFVYVVAFALPLALFSFKVLSGVIGADSRAPASVAVDLSHLEGESFATAAKVKMVEGLSITAQDGRHIISMGHFSGADDSKSSACQTYSRVEYEFAADDSVVSGEPTVMKVSGLCTVSTDPQILRGLEIPYAIVLREKPSDRTFSLEDRDKVEISFSNVGDEWPKTWSLKGATYVGASSLKIDAKDIYNFRGRPFIIRWP